MPIRRLEKTKLARLVLSRLGDQRHEPRLPYDQFVSQIAGDQLPNATQDDRVATGFLRNSMLNEEAASIPSSSVWSRSSIAWKQLVRVFSASQFSARSATHTSSIRSKHEDYYRMLAFLNDSNEATAAVYTPKDQMKIAEIFRRTAELEDGLRHRKSDWERRWLSGKKHRRAPSRSGPLLASPMKNSPPAARSLSA